MRHCSLQNIRLAALFWTCLWLAQTAHAADCDDIERAIIEGGEISVALALSCTSTAVPSVQAELINMAVRYRREDIAAELLRSAPETLMSPELIHLSALFEQPEVISILLQKKPQLLEARDHAGWTPLTSAALGRAYMAASVLLENGASDSVGQSIQIAVGRSREVAYLIIQRDRSWIADSAVAGDVLGEAIQYTDEPFLQFLLSLGLKPNLHDSKGYLVILHAAAHDSALVGQRNWEFMVRRGADELAAICSLEDEKVDHLHKHGADWFKSRLLLLRPSCS